MVNKQTSWFEYFNSRTNDDIQDAFDAGWNARLERILELKEMLKYLSHNCDNISNEVCEQIEELLEKK